MKKLLILCTTVLFILSCEPQDGKTPELTITTSNGQIVTKYGGGKCTFSYEITDPMEGGSVAIEIPSSCDWITDPVIDGNAGTITVTIAENLANSPRSEIVTVVYTYNEGSMAELVNVIQEESGYDYISLCVEGESYYMGPGMSQDPELTMYYIQLTTDTFEGDASEQSGYYYYIDLFNKIYTEDKLPVPGTYRMVKSGNEGDFNCTDYYTWGQIKNAPGNEDLGFKSGQVTVERNDNVYNIEASLTDTKGKKHLVRYTGELTFYNEYYLSTLTEDLTVDVSGYEIEAINWGNCYEIGSNFWMLNIATEAMLKGEPYISLAVATPMGTDHNTGFTAPMEFTEDDTLPYFFFPGIESSGYSYFSWYYTLALDYDEAGGVYGTDPYGPFLTGSITLIPNEDGTVGISTDAYEDRGFNMKITGSNLTITYIDGNTLETTQNSFRKHFKNTLL